MTESTRVRITLDVTVTNPRRLTDYARSRRAAVWHDFDWEPVTIDEAVYEALIASAEGPNPEELGIEISQVVHEVRHQ